MRRDAETDCRKLPGDGARRLAALAEQWDVEPSHIALAVMLAALSRQTADATVEAGRGGGAPVRWAFPAGLPLREAALRVRARLATGAGPVTVATPAPASELPATVRLEVTGDGAGGLTLRASCSPRQAERLLHALRHAYGPDATVGDVPVACPTDEADLDLWARTLAPIPSVTLDQACGGIARAAPGRTALVLPAGTGGVPAERRLAYGRIEAEAVRLARRLAGSGVRPGEAVVVACDDVERAVVGHVAVLKAGAVCVPVGRVTAGEAGEIAEVAGARRALCAAASREVWERHCRVLDVTEPPGAPPAEAALPAPDFTAPAYLLVGPGGGRHGRAALSAHTAWTSALASRTARAGHPPAGVVTAGDLSDAAALTALWWAFTCGAELRWAGPRRPLAPPGGAPEGGGTGTTAAVLSPGRYRRLLDGLPPAAGGGPGSVVLCGEPCSADLVGRHFARWPGSRLFAEFSGDGGPLPWAAREVGPADAGRALWNAGPPSPNVRVRVLDPAGRSLPPGLVGEVCAEGAALPHALPRRAGGGVRGAVDGPLRSGRLGRLRMDGSLELAGGPPRG
ncbi:AMP-binding protein [Streptomyces caatingaensis]|uniref:AMP-dependent synthetase/ligase domain-containing protein n=1 Tax=Streptomyces caatingaensis TaxID=1678637 RepID=A0A0K9XBK4_9ACTN|nr:AMP-binding protein [Streptomyces caatingaensis]KNB50779.1 hypothetical protein AC230_20220 [Streptomyces caatingaensis]